MATADDFTNIWNSADGTMPPAPVFSGWTGGTNDLRVQRVDLSPLFVKLLLSRSVSSRCCPSYSIDQTNNLASVTADPPTSLITYFIQNSTLYLYNHGGELDSQQILIRDNSFIYDQNVWRGSISGEGFLAGLDIASVVNRYLAAYPNVRAQNGTNQQAVVVQSMINFMDRYDDWAAAGFPYNGGAAPTYTNALNAKVAMTAAVQNQYISSGYHDPNEVLCQ